MTKHNLFSNVPATNGLARGYGPKPHKRKRKGLRFAVVVLLLALACVVYFGNVAAAEIKFLDAVPEDAPVKKQPNDRLGQAEKDAALSCLRLMEQINEGLNTVYSSEPDVNQSTLRMIEAFEGYCKNL